MKLQKKILGIKFNANFMLPNRTIILKILKKKKKLDKFKIREQSITSKYESMIPEKKKKEKKWNEKSQCVTMNTIIKIVLKKRKLFLVLVTRLTYIFIHQ